MVEIKQTFRYIIHVIRKTTMGPLSRILWLKKSILKFFLSLVCLLLGFYSYNTNLLSEEESKLNFIVWFVPILIGLSLLVYSIVKIFLLHRIKYRPDENPRIISTNLNLPDRLKTLDCVNNHKGDVQSILYDPEVNLILNQSKNLIKFEKKAYQIPRVIQENLEYFVLNMPDASWETFDSPKVRLTSELTKECIEENEPIILQESSYFKDRLSNSLAKYKYQKGNQILNLHNEFIKTETNEVISLNNSKLSNQLGASTLLFTKDNKITYLVQGSKTTENKNRWAPSGSGSFDFFKPKEKISFKDYSLIQAKRELKEESNLKENEILKIAICGFGRYIYRYGKPEIFCVATSSKMSDDIQIRAEEWDYQDRNEIRTFKIKGEITKKNLLEQLSNFKLSLENTATSIPLSNEFEQQVSGPLYWNVCFALDFFNAQTKEFIADFFNEKPEPIM